MIDVQNREIWARGITTADRGRRITVDDQTYLIRDVRPLAESVEVDVVTCLVLDNRKAVVLHD